MRIGPLLFLIAAWTPFAAAAAPVYLGSFGHVASGPTPMINPMGMDIAPDGTLWVAVSGLDKAKHFTITGGYIGETWRDISTPSGVTVLTTGEIAVSSSSTIALFPPDGSSITPLGVGGAYALVANPAGGFWATRRSFPASPSYLVTWPGLSMTPIIGASPAGFERAADGTFYVANAGLNRVDVFGGPGPSFSFGSFGNGPGKFSSPSDVAIADGLVLVADSGNHRIQIFRPDGTYVSQFGSAGTAPGLLLSPSGLAVAQDGTILVAELGNNRISRFGDIATPATASSWGRIKSLFR